MMNFSQGTFKPKIPNFIPLFDLVQLDLQIKLYDFEYQKLISIDKMLPLKFFDKMLWKF